MKGRRAHHGPSRQEEVTNCGDRCGGHRVGKPRLTSHWRVWAVSRRCAHLSAPVPLGPGRHRVRQGQPPGPWLGCQRFLPASWGPHEGTWPCLGSRPPLGQGRVVFMRRTGCGGARPGNLPPRPSASALHRDLSLPVPPILFAGQRSRQRPQQAFVPRRPRCSRVQAWPQLNQGRNSSCIITGWNSVTV